MMKCLPNCHNIDCADRRFTRFWKRMAAAGLPLLAHTGSEHTVPVMRREFSDPRVLEWPLQCGVTVIAAHCGTKSAGLAQDYFPVFVEMLSRYPKLYGDNSAFNVPVRGRHTLECLLEPVAGRILHGSDFPVPVLGHWAWMAGRINWEQFRESQRLANPLERDYQLKRAMGFAPETFTRIYDLLPVRNKKPGPSVRG